MPTLSWNKDTPPWDPDSLMGWLSAEMCPTPPPQAVGPKGFGESEHVDKMQGHSSRNGWRKEEAAATGMAGPPVHLLCGTVPILPPRFWPTMASRNFCGWTELPSIKPIAKYEEHSSKYQEHPSIKPISKYEKHPSKDDTLLGPQKGLKRALAMYHLRFHLQSSWPYLHFNMYNTLGTDSSIKLLEVQWKSALLLFVLKLFSSNLVLTVFMEFVWPSVF